MFELFLASDAARRHIERSLEPDRKPRKSRRVPPRRTRARSFSASALRRLADRLEPSLSA